MNAKKTKATYSLIAPRGAQASEYEIVSSRLLYYPDLGFEVVTAISDCYKKYQRDSPLQCRNWETFTDPRETTYASYIALQHQREEAIAVIFSVDREIDAEQQLSNARIELWEQFIAPQRYFIHALQMLAAYVGQMAPSGRVTLCSLFQAADELRKIEHIAYRLAQLRLRSPQLGSMSLQHWQTAPAWQNTRQLCEHLLVTYDFGEAFVALNLLIKPLYDWVLMDLFVDSARLSGEYCWAEVLEILREDSQWQRSWTRDLTRVLIADNATNTAIINGWISKWTPSAWSAVEALHSLYAPRSNNQLRKYLHEEQEKFLISCALRGKVEGK
jgi:hypothetical protein